jgi:hypothetical protein
VVVQRGRGAASVRPDPHHHQRGCFVWSASTAVAWNCGCLNRLNGGKSSRAMSEQAPTPRLGSTSRPYIIRRLRDLGLHGLVGAIEQGRVSAHTVAIELGWVRPRALHGGSPNKAKRRRFQVDQLIREGLFDAPTRQG